MNTKQLIIRKTLLVNFGVKIHATKMLVNSNMRSLVASLEIIAEIIIVSLDISNRTLL